MPEVNIVFAYESRWTLMLTEYDDYLCHQTTDAIEHPHTADPRFYSRHFIFFYNVTGEIAAITGIGCYPNNEVMDGFAIAAFGGETQRNLRVSRKLEHDPQNMTVGPVSIEMIEPLRKFRVVCKENFLGFGYDILCDTISRPFEREPRFRGRLNGRVIENTCHFNQGFRCTGTFTVDGSRYTVTPESCFGVRDHSWGLGRFYDGPYKYGPTGQGQGPGRGPYGQGEYPVGGHWEHWNTWIPFARGGEDRYLAFNCRPPVFTVAGELLYAWDDPRPSVKLVGIERKNVTMDEQLRRFKSCELVFVDEHGDAIEVSVRSLGTVYERGAGYGSVGTSYRMGKPMGELHVEGETWDIQHREFSMKPAAAHVVEVRWGGENRLRHVRDRR